MKLFIRKAWRDIKSKKLRSIPIIIVITIGSIITIFYSALYFNWLEVENASWIGYRYHHLLITTEQMDKSNLTLLVNQVKEDLNIDFEFELRDFHELQVTESGIESQVNTHLYAVRNEELLVDKLYYNKPYINTLHNSTDANIAVVEKVTAELQGWEINDELVVLTPSGILNLTVIAMVDSPEFMLSPGIVTEFYGSSWDGPVIWMKQQDWESHMNSTDQVNQIAIYFDDPSMSNRFLEEFLTAMSQEYGIDSVLQYSGRDAFLLSIAPTFSGMGLILSFVFAIIVGIMLFIVLKRILEEEITTLGIFKALGFSNREIATSAIIYSWLIGLIGGSIGITLGLISGFSLGDFYIELVGIKKLPNVTSISSILLLFPTMGFICLITFFTTAGSLLAVQRILRMTPIEAMRPQAMFKPARPVYFERILLKIKALSPLTKFSIRSVFQEKRKALFIIFGIILAMSISFFGSTTGTSFTTGIDKQFQFYEAWDMQITLNNYQNSSQIATMLENLPWKHYESYVLVPVRLKQDMTQNYVITGLNESTISRNFDTGGVPGSQKVVITKDLAIKFSIKKGDLLTVIDVQGNDRTLEVETILNEFTGGGLYTSIDTARWLAGIAETDYANGIYIHTEQPQDSDQIEERLGENPNVQDVIIKSELAKSVRDAMMLGYAFMLAAMSAGLIVGVAIAVSVVSISISERKYDFVNFRALGVSNREIFGTVLLELVSTSVIGIFIGFVTGGALATFIFDWAAEYGVVFVVQINLFSITLSILNVFLGIILAAYLSLRSLFRTSISEETVSRIIG
ncbi:MAG: ABC transporter permease [Candidatus Heimdallarchaeota archaeon]|nr:MAG: ABC transporter permease [Candidatus Heimdallarchaeota archaeon]